MACSPSYFMHPYLMVVIVIVACFPNYSRSSGSSSVLNGQHFRIASLDVRPYMIIDRTANQSTYRASGIVYEIIVWLSMRYNFTFSLVLPPDGTFGALVNGSWNGMIGMAINKQAELIAAPVVPSLDRARVLDFTTTFSEEPMCCLIPAPEADLNSLSGIVKPYTTYVWLLIIFSMLCVAVVTWLTSKFGLMRQNGTVGKRHRHGCKNMSFAEHLYAIFAIICLQPKDIMTHSPNSSPIVLSVWCLACVVLVYLYTGVFISYLTIPKMRPIVETVEELAESTRLHVVAIKNSIFETTLLQSTTGPLKTLGNQLRQNPENSLSGQYYNLELLLQKALLGRFGIMMSQAQAETLIKLDWNAKGMKQCRLSIMREKILSTRFCFALPKKFPYTNVIDRGIVTMYDVGLIDYWKNHSPNSVRNHCDASKRKGTMSNTQKKPLSLTNLTGTFVILSVGICIALLAFLVELAIASIHRMTSHP